MKQQRGLMGLVDDLAPVIAASFAKALAPVLSRLEAAEKRAAELETAPADIDLDAIVAAAIEKAMATQPRPEPVDVAAIERGIDERFAALPVPKDGNNADPEAVRGIVVAEVEKVVAALPKAPTAEDVAALIPPQPAKDADPALVVAEVGKAVAALPPAAPGKDADPEAVRAMVADAVAALPKPENGKDATPEAIAAAVEKVLAAWPKPKDGESVTIDELRPLVDETAAKRVAEIPKPKDGVGLAGVLKDHEGCVVFTLTDGSMIKLGRVDGEPGKNGLDGLGFDDLDVVDDGMAFTLRFSRGDQVKEFKLAKPTLADMHKGVWREGAYQRGAVVTWGGSTWLAKSDTEAKPETNDAWLLVTKRGRDGKDSVALEPKAPAPVKLR